MKKFFLTILAIFVLAILGLIVTGHGYIFTAVARTYLAGHVTANINDYKQFDTRVIETSKPQTWPTAENYPLALPEKLESYLENNHAIAFLVAQNGKIVSENYFKGYNKNSKTNSFSMAKTVLTLMLGKAIEEGYIKSLNQPMIDFIPEFKSDENGRTATIGSLSTMTSGFDWDEHYYSPFSPTVELLYGDDVEEFLLEREFSAKPEDVFYYSSASTQLLAIVLDRALKAKDPNWTLSKYLSEKFWQPLGMNDNALWHLDDEGGIELAYCCISTNARNYAKLGQMMLQNGQWNGQSLLDPDFIQLMIEPGQASNYGYSTWLNKSFDPSYYAFNGHLGQRIIVVQKYNLVIVRLGEKSPNDSNEVEETFYVKQVMQQLQL